MKNGQITARARRTASHRGRPTIGLFIGRIGDQRYQTDVWLGVVDAAEERNVNLVCFVGGTLSSPYGLDAQRNVVYNLANKENVDGLITLSGTLGHHIGPQELKHFYERYRPLPIVSTSMALDGIPSVLVDNEAGMHEAVTHLIEAHGRRRIAFICGPKGHPEAKQRYHAYVTALEEHSLPLDPNLVAPGDFVYASGVAAIKLLLDQRKVDFDAVVSANDEMTFGVMEVLRKRGIGVPDQVSVVSFDDIEEARFVIPPLTTTRQPFYEQGKRATELLLAILDGEPVPEQVLLPTKLVVRQSCGCFHDTVHQAAVGPVPSAGASFETALAARREQIVLDLSQGHDLEGMTPQQAEKLLDAFISELEGASPGTFLLVLQTILGQVVDSGGDAFFCQEIISTLRRHLLPLIDQKETLARADDLWQQARVLIGELSRSALAHDRLQGMRQAIIFSEISEVLLATLDAESLSDATARQLPRLGIESCYLSLYEQPVDGNKTPPAEWSRLVVAYNEQGRLKLEPGGRRFPTYQLVPNGVLSSKERFAMLVEPLHFGDEVQFGFVLMGPLHQQGSAFREIMLSRQISTALRVALLLQERKDAEEALKKYSERLEDMAKERTAELQAALQKAQMADKLKTEFIININHELRTPLTNLLLYHQMLSAHPTEKTQERLNVIGREIQRLRILIEDLLYLSRFDLGQVSFHPVPQELNHLLQSLINDRRALADERGLVLKTELQPGLPLIPMDEGLIIQAISNLLTNALNYTPAGGAVIIQTGMRRDSSGRAWVVMSVQDSGPGIGKEDLSRIFERFYRGKTGHESGAPGTGLGLSIAKEVVERHHGRIEAENVAKGRGAVFTIWLPVDSAPLD